MKIDKEVRKVIEASFWDDFEIYVSDYGNAYIVISGGSRRIGGPTDVAKLFLEFDKLFKEYECNVKKEEAFKNIKVNCD